MVSDTRYKPNANEINVIRSQQIFMNVVSALTILAKPITVDAAANFLLVSISGIIGIISLLFWF
jgi:hypothetical protein